MTFIKYHVSKKQHIVNFHIPSLSSHLQDWYFKNYTHPLDAKYLPCGYNSILTLI